MREYRIEDLRTLAYELPDEVEKYKRLGDFAAADAAVDRWIKKPLTKEMKTRLALEKQILKGLKEEFPYTEEQTLALFREKLPDFSAEDLRRLDESGLAEWIFLDGEKHYIHNVLRNAMQEDAAIRRRAGLKASEEQETQKLKQEIEGMRENGEAGWRFRLRCSIKLRDDLFYPGIYLRAHLPIPADLFQNSNVKIITRAKGQMQVDAPDSLFRTICLEDTLQENRPFFVEYEYTVRAEYRDAYHAPKDTAICGDRREKEEVLKACLKEQYPHIRFTPYLRTLADSITRQSHAQTDLEKARAIYDYITKNVKYSFMRSYFLIPDIPQYCARSLRGDCGVQSLLFITLCRICGIPARWQSGLYLGGSAEAGCHDWAMFYAAPFGWLYADPSFGGSAYRSGDESRREFYFGSLDPFRMAANNAFQQPFAVPKRFMPADPYDNQSGELESDSRGYNSRETVVERTLLEATKL